jgi:hypothetical protein
MSHTRICRRGAQIFPLCGLLVALVSTGGCGPKAAPPAPPKPKVEAAKTAPAPVQTNLSREYVSVFEDLPPSVGKDPFFPNSHRRDPVPVAASDVHEEPVFVLKGILRTRTLSQAVINNQVLETGEEEPVRVPSGHVRVRCLQIGNDYVLIQVEGESEPKRLTMDQKK